MKHHDGVEVTLQSEDRKVKEVAWQNHYTGRTERNETCSCIITVQPRQAFEVVVDIGADYQLHGADGIRIEIKAGCARYGNAKYVQAWHVLDLDPGSTYVLTHFDENHTPFGVHAAEEGTNIVTEGELWRHKYHSYKTRVTVSITRVKRCEVPIQELQRPSDEPKVEDKDKPDSPIVTRQNTIQEIRGKEGRPVIYEFRNLSQSHAPESRDTVLMDRWMAAPDAQSRLNPTARPADLTFGLPGSQTPGHIVPGAPASGPVPPTSQYIAQTTDNQFGEQDVTDAAVTPAGRLKRKRKLPLEPQERVDPGPEHGQKRKAGRPCRTSTAINPVQQQQATTTGFGIPDANDDEEMLILHIEQRKAVEARLADEMMLHALRKKQR